MEGDSGVSPESSGSSLNPCCEEPGGCLSDKRETEQKPRDGETRAVALEQDGRRSYLRPLIS